MEACSIILQPAVEKGGRYFPLSDHNIFQLGGKEKENSFVHKWSWFEKLLLAWEKRLLRCGGESIFAHFCPSLSIFVPGEQSNSPSAALQLITLPSSTTRTTGRPGPTVQKLDYTVSTEQAGALVLGVLALVLTVLTSTSIGELTLLLPVLTDLAMIPEVLREVALVLTALELVLTRLAVLTLSVTMVLVDA